MDKEGGAYAGEKMVCVQSKECLQGRGVCERAGGGGQVPCGLV